ncbi:glycosyltransferase family 2 protein [Candidatus Methylopumilus universalis]|uniref:glycosyltransferase family 2 protein n=1 Tax=Candidatus Methylopumilus universalis TaxID=2588536 RepID=UPI0011245032|nr:glycosyltransferase family 2 protein [Candidatus Methylopumilus universalis]QDC80354.1 glycosyltransferase [Candidatus Methylopumilus universalis]QDC81655.1 glycosyltransferase [Candidatus Methylopumilus universalis]QDC88093.1 glycosyltransferase [Candidatus Methylopumilus universalis]
MKLIIQIPCLNEAKSLPITLKELPRKVKGFKKVEWLIIDDGSADDTAKVAKSLGVDHIVQFTKTKGLAKGFMAGIEASLQLGADVIINTDADNQYKAKNIPDLLKPILDKKADIVIGARPIQNIEHFSLIKKLLQKLGSWVVRISSGTSIEDAPSGFRAMTRDAALRLNVFNSYTYTLETIIQAGQKNMVIVTVPIEVNKDMRPSRLLKSIPAYIQKSVSTIIRIFAVYRPFRFFMSLGVLLFSIGVLIGLRFLILFFEGQSTQGHIQSLILASIFIGMGFQTMIIAFIADLIGVNRNLLEDIQYRMRKKDFATKTKKDLTT